MDINPIPELEYSICLPLRQGMTMLELGNKKNEKGTYKAWFESQGVEHTSVDWNGLDGALKLDLRQPLGLGQFDMVTNFGCTEHVDDQTAVWRNIHEAVVPGGYLVGQTPAPGGKSWWWHGEHYPERAFYEDFASYNGYRIEYLEMGLPVPNENLYFRLCKVADLPFTMPSPDTIYKNHMRPR